MRDNFKITFQPQTKSRIQKNTMEENQRIYLFFAKQNSFFFFPRHRRGHRFVPMGETGGKLRSSFPVTPFQLLLFIGLLI